MRKIFVTLFVIFSAFLVNQKTIAQIPTTCFEIQSILVDACGNPEGENEMVRMIIGPSALNTSNININWPNNNYLGICQNVATAGIVATLNSTIIGCGFIKEPTGGVLPAGSTVLIVTSTNMNPSYNSFANLNDTIYMIFQCAGNVSGHFRNYSSTTAIRNLSINFGGACSDNVSYDAHLLVDQSGVPSTADGSTVNYDFGGTATYANPGCQAPIVPLASVVSSSVGSGSTCPGTQITITGQITSGNYHSVFWTNGNGTYGNNLSLNTTYQTDNSFTGNDQLLLGIVTNCNDTVYDTLDVNIVAGSVVDVTANGPTTFCTGGNVTLTAVGTGTYLWSNGETTASITVSSTDNYVVTLTGSCGTSKDSMQVTVNTSAPVTINASGPLTFCNGDSVTLSSSITGTYLWSNGATTSSITVLNTGNYTITVTGTCGNSQDNESVTVNSTTAVVINASGPLAFCIGDSVTLSAVGSGTFLWSTGATTSSITVLSTGNYTVTATETCGQTTDDETVTVVNGTLVSISASGPVIFCTGDSVTLTASNGNSFLWSTGETTQSITVHNSGNYAVTATANVCGVTHADTTVTVNNTAAAGITASGPLTFCSGSSVTLTASAGTGYLWSNGETTSSISVNQSGNFSVTVTSICGVATSPSETITVNPSPAVSIAASGPTTFCNGGSVTLTANGNGTYNWSDGSTATSITVNSAGNYIVTVTNSCGNTSLSQNIIVTDIPVLTITGGNVFLCPGVSETLVAAGGDSYLWSTGQTGNTIIVHQQGYYSVVATNSCGSDKDSVQITASTLIAKFLADTTFGFTPLTVHFTNQSQNAISSSWDFGDNSILSTDTNPTHTYTKEGIYEVVLTVTDINGCTATYNETITVRSDSAFYIPNVFTPNGDHKNDIFNAKGTGVRSIEGKVFNRWGQPVFDWTTLDNGWDGKFSGNDSPSGTYYYVVKVEFNDGKRLKQSGSVTLLR